MPAAGPARQLNLWAFNKDMPEVKARVTPKKWKWLQKLVANRRKNVLLIIIALAICLFAGGRSVAAQTVYEVEGTVYGPDSKAVPNVTVTLQNHAGAQIDQDITKTDGRYRFANVLAGTYYIAVKPAEAGLQQLLQKIELINTGVNVTNYAKERFDFSLRRAAL